MGAVIEGLTDEDNFQENARVETVAIVFQGRLHVWIRNLSVYSEHASR